jgi:hypothetical protein
MEIDAPISIEIAVCTGAVDNGLLDGPSPACPQIRFNA